MLYHARSQIAGFDDQIFCPSGIAETAANLKSSQGRASRWGEKDIEKNPQVVAARGI